MTASGHTGNSHRVFFADGSPVLKTKQDWTWFYKPPLRRDFLTLVRFDRRAGSMRLLSYSPSLNQYTKLDPASRRQGVDRLASVPFSWDVR